MGIDFERVQNTAQANIKLMTCTVCKFLLSNPSLCSICRTHFCYTCLKNEMASNEGKCPSHGEVIQRKDIRRPA